MGLLLKMNMMQFQVGQHTLGDLFLIRQFNEHLPKGFALYLIEICKKNIDRGATFYDHGADDRLGKGLAVKDQPKSTTAAKFCSSPACREN